MKKILLFALVLVSLSALAQQPVGSIAGTVTDANGGVIPGAKVTAIGKATGAARTVETNEQGYFLLPTLIPGEYKVSVEFKGFSTYSADGLAVAVGQITRVNPVLQVGTTQQSVEVTAAVAAVDTTQAVVGGLVSAKQIDELPLNGRNYLELAKLQPGIEIVEGRAFDPTKTRYTGISIAGRQGREARITIDGVDAVDEHVGTTTLNISQDSIQEFQVSTSSSDSSTGLSATGGVNIITRRGSQQYHGSGFAYGRGSNMAARPGLGPTAPDFDREQWGVNIGGPVFKDRLFWFGNFEKTHESSNIAIATPYFPALTSYPAPFDERSSSVRLDWRMVHSTDAFFRWSRNDNSNLGGFGGNSMPSNGNINSNITHQLVAGADTALTSRLVNGFRFGYTDFKNRVLRPPADAQTVAVPGIENYRIITDDGLLIAGPNNITPQSTFERFFQTRDDLTYSRGKHTLRGGMDATYRRVEVMNFVNCFPQLTVVSPASRNVADIPNAALVNFTIGNCNGKRIPGTSDNTHRNTRYSWYLNDSWRVRPNLTLNAGVRHEIDTHPLNNDLRKPSVAAPLLPNGDAATPIDKNNFSPQIGLAWDPWNNGKTSIRLGAGIYYAMRISNLVTNERATLAPFNSGNDTIAVTSGANLRPDFNRDGTPDFDFSPAISGKVNTALPIITAGQKIYIAAPPLTVPTLQITRTGTIISSNFQTPYSAQVNAGVQREVPGNGVVDVNFVYSRSVHDVTRDNDLANAFPGNGPTIKFADGSTPGTIQFIQSDGFSRYRALTARYDKRFNKRYQFTASYALSRLEATNTDGLGLGNTLLVNRNVKANFGPASLDRTHRLTLNGIANLPWGFRISGVSAWSSGLPVSALVGSADLAGTGITTSLLPGTHRGSLGRDVDSVKKLNALIRSYNLSTAGKALPRAGQIAPYLIEYPDSLRFGDSFISQDLQLSKTFKFGERLRIEGTAQVFNLFNISNLVGPAGLPGSEFNGTLTNIAASAVGTPSGGFRVGTDGSLLSAAGNRVVAGVDRASSVASLGAIRPVIPSGSGIPRAFQLGLRVSF